jgi:hypothetical protein
MLMADVGFKIITVDSVSNKREEHFFDTMFSAQEFRQKHQARFIGKSQKKYKFISRIIPL